MSGATQPDPTPLRRKEEHVQQLFEAEINVPEILKAQEAKMQAAHERAKHAESKLEAIVASARGSREHHEFEETQRILMHKAPHSIVQSELLETADTIRKALHLKPDSYGNTPK